MINYLYFAIRSTRREELLKGFQYAWHRPQDPAPWRRVDELVYESILLDLLEIYEFVEHEL